MFSIITLPDAPKASPSAITSTVVCIQAITTNNFTKINGAMKKLGYIHIHTSPQKGKEWEGIYSKVKIEGKGYVPFTRTAPAQARGVIWIKIIVGETPIVVATSRLESSGEGSALRKLQLDELAKIFSNEKVFIFAGDTNLPEWQKVETSFLDAWREQGTAKNEATLGADRPDRILYKGLGCEEFGVVPLVDADDEIVRYGVRANFSTTLANYFILSPGSEIFSTIL